MPEGRDEAHNHFIITLIAPEQYGHSVHDADMIREHQTNNWASLRIACCGCAH